MPIAMQYGSGNYTAQNVPPSGGGGSVSAPTYLSDPQQVTSNASWNPVKSYRVVGNGYVIVSFSMYSDGTSDTGTIMATIILNNNTIMMSGNRLSSASSVNLGAACTIGLTVNDGDVIQLNSVCTKNGTKYVRRHFLSFDCTVVAQ